MTKLTWESASKYGIAFAAGMAFMAIFAKPVCAGATEAQAQVELQSDKGLTSPHDMNREQLTDFMKSIAVICNDNPNVQTGKMSFEFCMGYQLGAYDGGVQEARRIYNIMIKEK